MKKLYVLTVCFVVSLILTGNAGVTFAQADRIFTLEELSQYNGKDGRPAYVAVDGIVYDVTNLPPWSGGRHFDTHGAGADVTDNLNFEAPHGMEKLEGVPIVGTLEGFEDSAPPELTTFQKMRPGLITGLGILNAVLALAAVLLFGLRRANKHLFKNQHAGLKKLVKPFSKIHPLIGMTLVVTALVHGLLALGTLFALHTGPLIWFLLLIMMLAATLGKKYRVKNWLRVHRGLDLGVVVLIIVHILMATNIL